MRPYSRTVAIASTSLLISLCATHISLSFAQQAAEMAKVASAKPNVANDPDVVAAVSTPATAA